jgi:Putative adhesin
MVKVEQTWPSNSFDAIGIRAHQGKFVIEGTDSDQVKLEGTIAARYSRNLELGPVGRWLKIYTSWQYGESQFTLQLPKSKIWTIDLFSGRAEVKVDNINARLHLWLGKGEAQIDNCRGAFSLTSGNADVRLKHFVETEAAEIPPLPREDRHLRMDDPESWEEWGEDWAQWGGEFGEKFLRRFFGQIPGTTTGINIQTGKGDIKLEEINAKSCVIRAARGDARLKRGEVGSLDMKIIAGDIECESILPTGDWNLRANRGDVRLSLPSDTTARLDLTTRHGDIHSKTPLVRVTRQGPESWHGNRMVGSIGTKIEGKIPEIRLSTLSGDIEIQTQLTTSPYYEKSEAEKPSSTPPITKSADVYNTPLAVLTALSEGKISIDEAERLLREFKS